MDPQKTKITQKRAESLLYPIAAFLLAGGLNSEAVQRSFASAIGKAQKTAGRRIEHIGRPSHYADLMTRWAHDARFVDRNGRPRSLPLDGENGFKTLLRSIDPALTADIALPVLTRYGNVRRTRTGRYSLVRPFFFASSRSSMAFEPIAYFLSDASATLGKILERTKLSRGPELFWRKVETTGLPERAVAEFIEFVRDRSLDFLEEIDDWLEARRTTTSKKTRHRKVRRIGLGLFSIYSHPEMSDPGL